MALRKVSEEVPELIAMAKSPGYDIEKASGDEDVIFVLDVGLEERQLRAAVHAGEVEVLSNSLHRMEPPFMGRLENTVLTVRALREYVESIHGFLEVQDAPKQADTQPQAGTVEAADSQPDSITSRQVATFFDGLPYTAENWPKRLSDTKWLQPAAIARGEVGGITGLWCPLILARLISGHKKGREQQKTLKALNSRFKINPALQPWRDAWNEHYALFTDAIDD